MLLRTSDHWSVFWAEGGRKTPLSSCLYGSGRGAVSGKSPVSLRMLQQQQQQQQKSSDTSQTKCIHSGRTESKKSALGGMWRERRPLDLCCIVIEASQVFQTGPVTELVLVLGRK